MKIDVLYALCIFMAFGVYHVDVKFLCVRLVVLVVVLLFYVHGIHLRSCRDGQLT